MIALLSLWLSVYPIAMDSVSSNEVVVEQSDQVLDDVKSEYNIESMYVDTSSISEPAPLASYDATGIYDSQILSQLQTINSTTSTISSRVLNIYNKNTEIRTYIEHIDQLTESINNFISLVYTTLYTLLFALCILLVYILVSGFMRNGVISSHLKSPKS